MTNLTESSSWDAGVLEFQTTDPIQGGPGGIDNQPHQSLVDRTLWLRNRMAAVITQAGLTDGTTDNQQLVEAVLIHCANVAALRALPIPVVPNSQTVLVQTRGQTTDGDGFGADYKWVFNSTAADNGTTVVEPSTTPTQGRWLLSGVNATALGGEPASFYVTAAQVAAQFETISDATAKLAAAEAFATAADTVVLTAAESFASSAAATAQGNAESFASSAAGTAQSNAESFASTAATNAQNAAIASAEAFATTAASNALTSAEAFSRNASNINSGLLFGNMSSITLAADPGTTPTGAVGAWFLYY